MKIPLVSFTDTEARFSLMFTPEMGVYQEYLSDGSIDFGLVESAAVQFVEQSLSDTQKEQARANIGAAADNLYFVNVFSAKHEEIQAAYDAGKLCVTKFGAVVCPMIALDDEKAEFVGMLTPHFGVKVISTADGSPTWTYVYSNAVQTVEQSLTEAQKEQARKNIGALSADDIDVDSIGSNIFIADYDTTTYAEIKAAHDAGKLCFARSSNMPDCQLLVITDSEAIFTREINEETDYHITFTSAGEKSFTLVDKNVPNTYVVGLFSAKYAEIKSAYEAGKACFVTYGSLLCHMTTLDEESAKFIGMITPNLGVQATVPAEGTVDWTYVRTNAIQHAAQTLSDEQKAQARTNIGALSTGDVDTVLQQAKDSGQFDGKDGEDGKTPVKGVDYFDGKDGYTPVKGKDYFDGYTPVKGKDYFDGATGKTAYAYAQDGGYTGTEAEFAVKLASDSEPLVVTLSGNDTDGYTADKTVAEIYAARNAGRDVYMVGGVVTYQLSYLNSSFAAFSYTLASRNSIEIISVIMMSGVAPTRIHQTIDDSYVKYTAQSLDEEYKLQARTNIGAAAAADIAQTASLGISNSAAVYVKISDFGSWGTGAWYQKGFAMLITSRAGEMVWVAISSDDSNTNAKAIRLLNTYSKIAAIYYSASESAVYVKANAWCNNINAHIISNINGDYVPTVAQASALPSDAVQITITEFGAGSGKTSIGDASRALGLTGSATRPTYNGADMALSSDISSGNANTATMPLGFASRVTGAEWGNTIGTSFTSWNDPTGGSIDFRQDNPSSGKMSIKVDGRVYVNEGLNPVMGTEHANGYWGMTSPDGENNAWIRTTTSGIIPYQEGGAGNGHCYLGTSTWYFGESYIDRMYSTNLTLAGRAYMNDWIQCNGEGGLFFPNHYGMHIMANNVSTYTPLRIVGEKTTYNGVLFGNDSTGLNVMSNAEHQGLYNESLSRWITYYHRPTDKIGIGTAGLSGSTITLGGSTNVQGILTQGSPSEDASVALMNRFQSDLFVQGSGAAPNGPTVAGFYLGKSASDENRHMDIVSGGDYSYIDFNKAGRAADYDARLLVNVANGYTEFMWGSSGEITQRVLNIQGSLRKNGVEVATQNDVVEAANGSLKVTLSGNDTDGYSVDKTYAEIQTAWNAGRYVYVTNGAVVYNPSLVNVNLGFIFTYTRATGDGVEVWSVLVNNLGTKPTVVKKTITA